MIPGISTQVFLSQRLDTSMLDALQRGGARAIELWAARFHVDYTDRPQIRELAAWFRASDTLATLHAPLTTDQQFSRHASPTVNLLDPDRGRRIAAMDEIKRALELAESIPIRSCVLHLGERETRWSDRVFEYALTAVEHLKAFAGPLGVQLLLENLRNEVATPTHLLEVLRVGHFDTLGICLDTGHAHLDPEGLLPTLDTLRHRVAELHLNDNSGRADEHFWPASGTERPASVPCGTIPWAQVYPLLETLPPATPGILEVAETPGATLADITRLLAETLSHARRLLSGEPA